MANHTATATKSRIASVDIARFYGIVLVYYGHIVEQVMYTGSAEAAVQYKLIYSFHMPLFFLLSGTIVSEKKLGLPFFRFFKQTMASRLLPYVFFSAIMGILSLFLHGWFPLGALTDGAAYLQSIFATLMGFPAFCIPLWFMALLISVEIFHALISKLIKHSAVLIVVAFLLYLGGYYVNESYNFVAQQKSFYFINEVPVVYLFYVCGVLLQRSGLLSREFKRVPLFCGALCCLALVSLTYDLNEGPFRLIQAVVIVLSGHGNIVLFPLTALIGSLFILLAAKASPNWKWLSFLGKNALSLFCLNGFFYHFVNPVTASWFTSTFTPTHLSISLYTTLMTVASLVFCLPMVYLLTTYLPQLMGKPSKKGPLLPAIIRS